MDETLQNIRHKESSHKQKPMPPRSRNLPSKHAGVIPQGSSDYGSDTALDNPDLGPFLLKVARDLIISGDNPGKALECASRAAESFDRCSDGKPSIEFVMSLHILAAIHCSLEQFEEAIPVLERSIRVPVIDDEPEYALAAFAGNMQLGDTYAMLGRIGDSLNCYHRGMEIQKEVLGDMDPRFGETCRYVAEAHVQAMQFSEAEKFCQRALEIHKVHGGLASVEEAADKRLMALICEGKGDYEAALENLVLASMALMSHGLDVEVASVDCSIGDTYLAMRKDDEAMFAYQKALTVLKSAKGENHPSVAAVYVRLADVYSKTGKLREARAFCESALRIYEKPSSGSPLPDIVSGLTEIAVIYESMNEPEHALGLLHKALEALHDAPGQQSVIVGIEAQMGVVYSVLGKHAEARDLLRNAIAKLRASGEMRSVFFGIVLNQMGLACVQCYAINEAADLFEESRLILEEICGPYHPDTLAVCSNLAGTYDAMGRLDDAIGVLEHVVGIREKKLDTENADVDVEKQRLTENTDVDVDKQRLTELLKEAGKAKSWKAKSLQSVPSSQNKKK